MKKRKILYISGTRADYGLMREVLFQIKKHSKLKIEVVVTGMHLMPEFGETINEIKKDKFKLHLVEAVYRKDSKESIVNFIGDFAPKLTKTINRVKPDIILVLGDRAEMLVGAMVGAYSGIPVAHVHGGEVTSTIDELTRHVITKLSYIHFPATKKSAERIIKMGEEPWRIFIVGAPGLDSALNKKFLSKNKLIKKYKLVKKEPILLVIQHPVTLEIEDAPQQIRETMEAIKELGCQTIIIYPNADPGGRRMIKILEEYRRYSFIKIYKNIPHEDYLGLMKIASAMVGNSSSGIIEAPFFYLPVINIGSRQKGREKSENIIDVDYDKKQIKKIIKKVIYDKKPRDRAERLKGPYGNNKTGQRIANIVAKIKINKKLLLKRLTY